MALGLGQLLGDPEGHAGRKDGHLRHRIGVLREDRDQGVAGLVDCHRVLLFGKQGVGCLPPAEQQAVARGAEVSGGQDLAIVPNRDDGRLVDQVGQVGAGEPGRSPGHHGEIDVGTEVLVGGVHEKNGPALRLVRKGDLDGPVEAAGAK